MDFKNQKGKVANTGCSFPCKKAVSLRNPKLPTMIKFHEP